MGSRDASSLLLVQPTRLELSLLNPQLHRHLGLVAAHLRDEQLRVLAADELARRERHVAGNDSPVEFSFKRVIGLPGETVQIRLRNGAAFVFVNGDPLDEPYVEADRRDIGPRGVIQRAPGSLLRDGRQSFPVV